MECCGHKPSVMDKIKALFVRNTEKSLDQHLQTRKIALIGNPNVGKSVIFNRLTGAYVTVSNYPGTTVDVSRGWYQTEGIKLEVTDTPGMYSMLPITEEERVTRTLLLHEKPDLLVHVVDAKNLQRMLPLTLQLIESGFPVLLVLNIMDEAKALGVKIDIKALQKAVGVPVIEASAALNVGLEEMKNIIQKEIRKVA